MFKTGLTGSGVLICFIYCFTNVICDNDTKNVDLKLSESTIFIEVHSKSSLGIHLSGPLDNETTLSFLYDIGDVTYDKEPKEIITPLHNITIPENNTSDVHVIVHGVNPGHVVVALSADSTHISNLNDTYVHISVVHSRILNVIAVVIGWMYFAAWSISFYPQVILNIKRKSVTGLNFDFLALNFIGFLFYSLFNVGLFFIPKIQDEYHEIHPRGIIPVEINDVVFALHALLLTIVTIGQCFCLKRDKQRVSKICLGILALIGAGTVIVLGVMLGNKISYLNVLYFFSYVKLGITIIKYIPQAWFNYRRKSTVGWSIGNILLDFTGGSLSMLQMFMLAYNNDDWGSLFGNPTKFGLGLFSLLFDIVFMIQHYCLYRVVPGYSQIIDPETGDRGRSYGSTEVNGDPLSRPLVT